MRLGAFSPRRAIVVIACAVSFLAVSFLFTERAGAHELGLSRGDYVAQGDRVETVVGLARREGVALLPEMDTDRSGTIGDDELAASGAAFAKRVFDGVRLEADGKVCTAKPEGARLVAEDGIEVFGAFECPTSAESAPLVLSMPLLAALSTGHRHLVKLSHGGKLDEAMLHKKEPSLRVPGGAATSGPRPVDGAGASSPSSVFRFFTSGIAHILTGWDHLLFLVGIGFVAGVGAQRMRSVLLAVTAFTAAHTITLALAILGAVHPTPTLVDALVALGLAYVGVESLLATDPRKYWRVTIPFGLAHGFAVASASSEVGFPGGGAAGAMTLFDLGVLAAQIGVLAVVVPGVSFLAKQPARRTWGARVASAALIGLGLVSFVRCVIA